jgi:LysR family transcriptional regulator, cyn operon transcriptional activator
MDDVHTIIHTLSGGQWATILTQAAVRGEANLKQIPILCADSLSSQGCLLIRMIVNGKVFFSVAFTGQ